MAFGISFFDPLQGAREPDQRRGVTPHQEAIRILSLRLPRVISGSALAPSALLTGPGGGGSPFATSAVAQALAQLAGLPPVTAGGGPVPLPPPFRAPVASPPVPSYAPPPPMAAEPPLPVPSPGVPPGDLLFDRGTGLNLPPPRLPAPVAPAPVALAPAVPPVGRAPSPPSRVRMRRVRPGDPDYNPALDGPRRNGYLVPVRDGGTRGLATGGPAPRLTAALLPQAIPLPRFTPGLQAPAPEPEPGPIGIRNPNLLRKYGFED